MKRYISLRTDLKKVPFVFGEIFQWLTSMSKYNVVAHLSNKLYACIVSNHKCSSQNKLVSNLHV